MNYEPVCFLGFLTSWIRNTAADRERMKSSNQCCETKYGTLNVNPDRDPEFWPNVDPDPGICQEY